MKKSWITIVFFLSLLLILISCDNVTDISDITDVLDTTDIEEICMEYGEDVLLPSELGNTWEYWIWGDFEDLVDTVTYSIIDTLTINYEGIDYHCFIPQWENYSYEAKWLYYNGEDGLYLMGGLDDEDTLILPALLCKYPVEVGDSWEYPRIVYLPRIKFWLKDTMKVECVGKDEEFITSLDTFSTYVYRKSVESGEGLENDVPPDIYYDHYCPGIGIVGNIRQSEEIGIHITGEYKLIDYCLY